MNPVKDNGTSNIPSFDDIKIGDILPDGGVVVSKTNIKTEEGKSLFRRMTVNYISDDIEVNDLIGKRFNTKSDMANHEFIGTCIGIKKDTDGIYIFKIEDQEGNVFDCSRKDIIMIGDE